jgi:DNA-binding transcriptional regulator YiaG
VNCSPKPDRRNYEGPNPGTTNSVVRARIDQLIKEEAAVALAAMGLSVSDAFRLMMVRIAIGSKSYKIHISSKINVRAVRRRLNMTQEEFAIRYRLTLARVRDWEQERSTPDITARA